MGFSKLELFVIKIILTTIFVIVSSNHDAICHKGSQIRENKMRLVFLKLHLEKFNDENGYYPKSLDELLKNENSNIVNSKSISKYLLDTYGTKFQYYLLNSPVAQYTIYSYGADSEIGGIRTNRDLVLTHFISENNLTIFNILNLLIMPLTQQNKS